MPAVTGVLETVLYTRDMQATAGFYRGIMGLDVLHEDARMTAFDVAGRGTLLLFREGATRDDVATPGGIIPAHDGSGPIHIAFAIARGELDRWEAHLALKGVPVESRVDWPRGGRSVYFRDPDGHLVELATPGLWKGY